MPGHGRTMVAMILLGLSALGDLIAIVPGLIQYQLLERMAAGNQPPQDELDFNDSLYGLVGVGQLLVSIGTATAFLLWIYRAYKNLTLLGVRGLTYSAGWAVGYFFIPFINLFRPCQVVQEMWKASNPEVPVRLSWGRASASALVGFWWASWLISNIVSNIAARIFLNEETTEALKAGTLIMIVADVLGIIAATLAILVIKQIQQGQALKWQRFREETLT